MILDKHLTFLTPTDGAKTTSRAICLTQDDLSVPNNGMAPYDGLYLCVIAAQNVSNLSVTLEHCDTDTGTFSTLVSYPAVTVKAGEVVIKAPVPFKAKNWLRVKLSSSSTVYAFLTTGVDKGVVIDD